ncbi:MAG: dockerin type I repeat-containing protein [bacterium]
MSRSWILAVVLCAVTAVFAAVQAEEQFYFGAWVQSALGRLGHFENDPEGFLHNAKYNLGFNLIQIDGQDNEYELVSDSGLKMLARPYSYAVGCCDDVYPLMLANFAAYSVWEADPSYNEMYTGYGSGNIHKLQWNSGISGTGPRIESGWMHFVYDSTAFEADSFELVGPYVRQVAAYIYSPWGSVNDPTWLQYTAEWHCHVGPPEQSGDDTIAILAVKVDFGTISSTILVADTLLSSEFASAKDTVVTLSWDYDGIGTLNYTFIDSSVVEYAVDWHGSRDFSLNKVVVHDQKGASLVADSAQWEDSVLAYMGQHSAYSDDILYLTTVDDVAPRISSDQYIPMRIVNSILRDRGYGGLISLHSWDPRVCIPLGLPAFTTYPYPFLWDHSSPGYNFIDTSSGPQDAEDHNLQTAWWLYTFSMNDAKKIADSASVKWLATLQAYDLYQSGHYTHRYPTRAEFLCQFNLTLAHDPDGVMFYHYWCWSSSDSAFVHLDTSTYISDSVSVYYWVRDDIKPLKENLVPKLKSMDWDTAWLWSNSTSPPSTCALDSILCEEFYGQTSDDSLYLQVARFDPTGSDAEYYMLVNRRCLSTEDITLHVYFDDFAPENDVLQEYVITEIVGGDTIEVVRQDLVLTFADTIDPGAARLYKIDYRAPTASQSSSGWATAFGGLGDEEGVSVVAVDDSSYVVAGWSKSYSGADGDADFYLVAVDHDLNLDWTVTYGSSEDDFCNDMGVQSDGDFVVVGQSFAPDDEGHGLLMMIDADGDSLNATYAGTTNQQQAHYSVKVFESDSIVIAGMKRPSSHAGLGYALLLKWTPSGVAVGGESGSSDFFIEGNNYNVFYSVALLADGAFAAVGETFSTESQEPSVDVLFAASPPDLPDTAQALMYGGTCCLERGYSIIQEGDSILVIAGSSYSGGQTDVYLLKIDLEGDTLWTRTFGGNDDEAAFEVIENSDGNYVVAGYTDSEGAGGKDFYILEVNASTGDLVWDTIFGGTEDDVAKSIVELPGENAYVVAGYTESFGSGYKDLCVLKFDDPSCDWKPGDANGDGVVNVTDATYLIQYIFNSGPAPTPYPIASGDANCDCLANTTDAVYIVQYVFNGGPAPCTCEEWIAEECGSY